MSTTTRPLPEAVKTFLADADRVVAATDDRGQTIAQLHASFATLLHDSTWLHAESRGA